MKRRSSRVEEEVRGYLRSRVPGLIAGYLSRGFTVIVGDRFCNLIILITITRDAEELSEALRAGDIAELASFMVVGVRKGSRFHGNLVKDHARLASAGELADVDLVITRRCSPNCCDVHVSKLKEGFSPEGVAREVVEENLDHMAGRVLEEAKELMWEGGCRGKRDCIRKVLGLEGPPGGRI
jgi:hypothetical protein